MRELSAVQAECYNKIYENCRMHIRVKMSRVSRYIIRYITYNMLLLNVTTDDDDEASKWAAHILLIIV